MASLVFIGATLLVGRAILPAAAFQAALSGHARVFARGKRRLKAGGSQDWLPHNHPSFLFLLGCDRGAWDYVFVRGPVAQVDDAAALAAKREIGVALGDRFLTDRASHHTATRAEILRNAEVAGGGAGSVGASSVPTTS